MFDAQLCNNHTLIDGLLAAAHALSLPSLVSTGCGSQHLAEGRELPQSYLMLLGINFAGVYIITMINDFYFSDQIL